MFFLCFISIFQPKRDSSAH